MSLFDSFELSGCGFEYASSSLSSSDDTTRTIILATIIPICFVLIVIGVIFCLIKKDNVAIDPNELQFIQNIGSGMFFFLFALPFTLDCLLN